MISDCGPEYWLSTRNLDQNAFTSDQRELRKEFDSMAYVKLTEDGITRAQSTRMILIERAENRRFSLAFLTGFLLVFMASVSVGSNQGGSFSPVMVENSVSWALRSFF